MASLKDEIGDFVGIPHSFMEDTKQTAESRVVFMVLRYHTNRKSKRAFPGYATIMAESGLSRQKTAAGIKILTETGWLVKHKKFAKVTEYEIRYPTTRYSSTEELREGAAIVPPANAVSSTEEQPPYSSEQDQSNKRDARIRAPEPPIKSQPPFRTQRFTEALAEFEAHRREMRKTLQTTGRKRLYEKLAVFGEADATVALQEAVANGWSGVFRPKSQNGHNGNGAAPRASLSPEARARKEAELRERMTGQRA